MLEIHYLNSFKRDYKWIKKRGYDMSKLADIIRRLCHRNLWLSGFMIIL